MAVRIGVLALQGAFAEHERALAQCGAQVCEIRARRDLMGIQGLVLPGGESTVMGTLLQEEGLLIPLRDLCRGGMPVLATCAGMILLAADLPDFALQPRLGVLDISVRRNAFGRQQESFTTFLQVRTFCASAADRVEASSSGPPWWSVPAQGSRCWPVWTGILWPSSVAACWPSPSTLN